MLTIFSQVFNSNCHFYHTIKSYLPNPLRNCYAHNLITIYHTIKSYLNDPLDNWVVSQLWHLKELGDAERIVPVRVKLAETLFQPSNLDFVGATIVLQICVIFGYIAMLQLRKLTSSGENPSTASMGSEFFAPILRPC